MRDLKIRPGMDTPKAKLKNPTPKDAESILKKHMDKRQKDKEPESRDPVRYATDRVEKTMRRGASGAADASRRMIKHYRGKLRQGKENAAREYRVADMGIGAESGSTNAPTEYDFSPAQTTARNEVGKQTFSPQHPNAAKNASAAPQERGRQKAVRDAKAAYRRNLAEKRTAERHIVPPPSDRGGTMTTPQKGNSGVSAKGSPAPKSGQAMTKVTRTMSVRPTDHAAPNNAIITHRARAAAQRKAQRAMLQDSVKNGGNAAKKLSGTAVQAIKAMGRGVASAVSSILSAGGGAVVLVLLLTVILVAAIVASPFGILFSNENREAGVVPISAAVAQINYDFNAKLETLQTADDYDSISVDGQAADWVEVLAVFAVKVAGSDDVDAADVATMDADRIARLKAVFWDMTIIAHRVEVIHHPGSGESDDGWTERNLHITIAAKTAEEMKTVYHFSRNQVAALAELLEQRDKMIFVYGTGFSGTVATYLTQKLVNMGILCFSATGGDSVGIFENTLDRMGLFFGISKSGETTMVRDKIRTARENGVFTVAITGEQENSVGRYADLWFRVENQWKLDDQNTMPNTFFPQVMMLIELIAYEYRRLCMENGIK